jgi:geranylgeranyl pyrophosphate synthase
LSTPRSFFSPAAEDLQAVENLMRSQANGYHEDIHQALNLLLSAGGKRVRPSMTILIGKMLGADRDQLVTLAAAIELLHTATLVHDDLIDSALLRRGMPTLNSKWSPGATVLTGDFLFACAARLAAETDSLSVMKVFSRTLATIVDGEISQLFTGPCQFTREGYFQRIYAKTASLFETAARTAAMISQASEQSVDELRDYGYQLGMAFQIVDDILDFTSQPSELGKPVGSDLQQGLVTLPAILYAESHPNDADLQAMMNTHCEHDPERVQELIHSIRNSSAIRDAHREACDYIERALAQIRKQPDSEERASLENLARYIVERQI